MQYIVTGAVVGFIAIVILGIFYINSGNARLARERNEERADRQNAEARLNLAKRALYEIAGNQTGNPTSTAISALDEVDNFEQKELHK